MKIYFQTLQVECSNK